MPVTVKLHYINGVYSIDSDDADDPGSLLLLQLVRVKLQLCLGLFTSLPMILGDDAGTFSNPLTRRLLSSSEIVETATSNRQ